MQGEVRGAGGGEGCRGRVRREGGGRTWLLFFQERPGQDKVGERHPLNLNNKPLTFMSNKLQPAF